MIFKRFLRMRDRDMPAFKSTELTRRMDGLTKRQYAAMFLLQGILAEGGMDLGEAEEQAVLHADRLFDELEKP